MNKKDEHIRICLNEPIDYSSLDAPRFPSRLKHDALPELDFDEITLETEIFGKKLHAPLMIGAMTGGTELALTINKRLAQAAQACQIGFALGSQRRWVEARQKNADPTILNSYDVKSFAPELPLLIGNLGLVQLNYGISTEDVQACIHEISCDAFCFHLNALQEIIQPEGNRNFKGLIHKLESVLPFLKVPVLIKEVGCGFSEKTLQKIKHLPLAGLEVSGQGGTSWAKIESMRNANSIEKSTGEVFADWGISTLESVVAAKKLLNPQQLIIASGGIRNGRQAAELLAQGADLIAISLPFLKAAEKSTEAVILEIQKIIHQLKTALFLTGAQNIGELRK